MILDNKEWHKGYWAYLNGESMPSRACVEFRKGYKAAIDDKPTQEELDEMGKTRGKRLQVRTIDKIKRLLAKGMSSKQIAKIAGVSLTTVNTYARKFEVPRLRGKA